MTKLSLGQAARLAQVGKSTLARAIKAGRLSANRTPDGQYEIDAAELARVYPFPAPGEAAGATVAATGLVDHATAEATLRAALAEQRAALAEQTIADLRIDRDHWREVASRLALAGPSRTPWWRRLLGR